jgi:site-specific DNA recombinase
MITSNSNALIRVVLYLRRSTDKQETSIEDQRAALIEYAAKHGYEIVGEYKDEGISGDSTEKRLGFLKMRDECSSGGFDLVLAWDIDRFSRNDPLELGYWLKPFRDAGVGLETIAQGRINWDDFAGRITYMVQQEGKHAFLRDLSRNVTRGLLSMAKAGKGTGGNRIPFGYQVKREVDDRGRLVDYSLEVDPEKADLVRRIYHEYLERGSLRAVCDRLNSEGIPSSTGRKWSGGGVRYILTNRKYLGDFVWGLRTTGRYNGTCDGELITRPRNAKMGTSENPVVVVGNHEQIIDEETFERVQKQLKANSQNTSPKRYHQYLFSGLLKCGDCGGALGGVARRDYRGLRYCYQCRTYGRSGSSSCYCNWVEEKPLADYVARRILDEYLSDEALDRLRKAIRQEQKPKPAKSAKVQVAKIRKRIKVLDQKIDQGAEKVLDASPKVAEVLLAKIEELRDERDRLKVDLKAGQRPRRDEAPVDEAEVEKAIRALRKLRAVFERADREEVRQLIRSFISRIEIEFSHGKRGKLVSSKIESGRIYVRPDALPSQLCKTGSQPSHLCKTELRSLQVWRFTREDLRRAA